MRRVAIVSGLAAGALTASGVVSVAGAAPGAPAVTTAETHRFAVRFSPFFFSDLDQNGRPSKGDQIVFHDLLFAHGRRVGQDGGSCTLVEDSPLLASCTGTIELSGGQITFQWLNSPPPRKVFAVTGGTRRFQNVRGEGILVEDATGPTGSMTLHLLP